MNLSRGSLLWTLLIIGSIVGYLASMPPPFVWTWAQWMSSIAALVGILAGKFATSPLNGRPDALKVDLSKIASTVLLAVALGFGAVDSVGCHAFVKAPTVKTNQAKLAEIGKTAAVLEHAGKIVAEAQKLEIDLAAAGKISPATHRTIQTAFRDGAVAAEVSLTVMHDLTKADTDRRAAAQSAIAAVGKLISAVTGSLDPNTRTTIEVVLRGAAIVVDGALIFL